MPATRRKLPDRITNAHQPTMSFHRMFLFSAGMVQLSYSHINPYGWNDSKVPRRAPTRDTRPPKTGMALATTYETSVIDAVHPSQLTQWIIELLAKCLVPRSMRMKMYLAGNYKFVRIDHVLLWKALTWMTSVIVTHKPGNARPYEIRLINCPADPRAGQATYEPQ